MHMHMYMHTHTHTHTHTPGDDTSPKGSILALRLHGTPDADVKVRTCLFSAGRRALQCGQVLCAGMRARKEECHVYTSACRAVVRAGGGKLERGMDGRMDGGRE